MPTPIIINTLAGIGLFFFFMVFMIGLFRVIDWIREHVEEDDEE